MIDANSAQPTAMTPIRGLSSGSSCRHGLIQTVPTAQEVVEIDNRQGLMPYHRPNPHPGGVESTRHMHTPYCTSDGPLVPLL